MNRKFILSNEDKTFKKEPIVISLVEHETFVDVLFNGIPIMFFDGNTAPIALRHVPLEKRVLLEPHGLKFNNGILQIYQP